MGRALAEPGRQHVRRGEDVCRSVRPVLSRDKLVLCPLKAPDASGQAVARRGGGFRQTRVGKQALAEARVPSKTELSAMGELLNAEISRAVDGKFFATQGSRQRSSGISS